MLLSSVGAACEVNPYDIEEHVAPLELGCFWSLSNYKHSAPNGAQTVMSNSRGIPFVKNLPLSGFRGGQVDD